MPARRAAPSSKRSSLRIAFSPRGAGARVTIEDPAAVKVLYDPLRFAIVAQLDRPLAVKEIAERLGEPISKLYYHLKALERHGLIHIADERAAGSNVEKLYGRSAEEFSLSGPLASPPPPAHLEGSLRSAMERISEGLGWSRNHQVESGFSQFLDYREVRLSARGVEELVEKLAELAMSASDDEEEASATYGVLYVMSPVKPKRAAGKRRPHVRVVRRGRKRTEER